ncbi:formyltransferase family protein [Streptomyces sp. NBC_00239]|uniref:formyltransferase family protein n=1 Tax=Streptomyces sp. NBC_00239 TaxID=2903640 RepID=UPI002E2E6D52|nr:formyltransferase family protein [Streptomyces sp. NBC_00239]
MESTCVLMSEGSFHAAYLMSLWLEEFDTTPSFGGIFVRDDPGRRGLYRQRVSFHRAHAGKRDLTAGEWEQLRCLYPDLGETDESMVGMYGVPSLPADLTERLGFLGENLNSEEVRSWAEGLSDAGPVPYFFVFLDQLLAPWWIELAPGRIVNAHSAVLPHARGMYATEQVAALHDMERFRQCAGATVHFVDAGVDTGPVIRADRLRDPFAFKSVWECKGASFRTAFDLLAGVARDVSLRSGTLPAGLRVVRPDDRDFRGKDFTTARRAAAVAGYARMKQHATAG